MIGNIGSVDNASKLPLLSSGDWDMMLGQRTYIYYLEEKPFAIDEAIKDAVLPPLIFVFIILVLYYIYIAYEVNLLKKHK